MATPTAPATYVRCKPWYDPEGAGVESSLISPFNPKNKCLALLTKKKAEVQGYEASCLMRLKIALGHEDSQQPGDTDHWSQPS